MLAGITLSNRWQWDPEDSSGRLRLCDPLLPQPTCDSNSRGRRNGQSQVPRTSNTLLRSIHRNRPSRRALAQGRRWHTPRRRGLGHRHVWNFVYTGVALNGKQTPLTTSPRRLTSLHTAPPAACQCSPQWARARSVTRPVFRSRTSLRPSTTRWLGRCVGGCVFRACRRAFPWCTRPRSRATLRSSRCPRTSSRRVT
jgi:hypothetical protein